MSGTGGRAYDCLFGEHYLANVPYEITSFVTFRPTMCHSQMPTPTSSLAPGTITASRLLLGGSWSKRLPTTLICFQNCLISQPRPTSALHRFPRSKKRPVVSSPRCIAGSRIVTRCLPLWIEPSSLPPRLP